MEIKLDKGPWFGIRYVIATHLFILVAIAVGMRVHLSVAIVAMTNNTSPNPDIPSIPAAVGHVTDLGHKHEVHLTSVDKSTCNPKPVASPAAAGTYNWTNKSVILSSFFWGYIFLQIPAGQIGRKYGNKIVLIFSMTVNNAAHMFVPMAADLYGSQGVIVLRTIQGLAQGFFFPCSYALLGKWAPIEERSFMGSLVLAGISFGTVVTMPIIGYVCSTWTGWPPSFYFYGVVGFIWIISWFYYGADSPAQYRGITKEEINYIERSKVPSTENDENVPWKVILTSPPVWAIITAQMGMYYGYITLITELPNFLSQVLKFDIHSNGLLSALPYLSWFILGFVFGYVCDFLMNKNYLSRTAARKLFTTIGFCTPALALVILSLLPDDAKISSVALLIVSVGANAAVSGGFLVNHIDLSPKFSGILMGIGNTFGSITALMGPLVVHFIVTDETKKSLWAYVFFICAGLFVSTNIVYVLFGSGELQPWNESKVVKIVEDVKTPAESMTNGNNETDVHSPTTMKCDK